MKKSTNKGARATVAICAGLVGALIVACSSSDDKPKVSAGGSDSSITYDVVRGPPTSDGNVIGEGGTCNNTMAAGAPYVAGEAAFTEPPAPTGGTILTGTYFLTKAIDYYPGKDAAAVDAPYWLRETLIVTGTTFDSVNNSGDFAADGGYVADGPDNTSSERWQVSGTSLTLSTTCPTNGGQATVGYSMVGNTLHLFDPASSELIYTRQ